MTVVTAFRKWTLEVKSFKALVKRDGKLERRGIEVGKGGGEKEKAKGEGRSVG